MTRQYYAANLIGDDYKAIETVYSFDYYSQRQQWVTEEVGRIAILAKIAKKHTPIEVTFEHYVNPYGYAGWVWMYNGVPETGE